MKTKLLIGVGVVIVVVAAALLTMAQDTRTIAEESEVQLQTQSITSPVEESTSQPTVAAACRNFKERAIEVGSGQRISVVMADNPAKRSLGLGGCEAVPENAGMYFPYDEPQTVAYWMKGMVMPIDIVWIREGVVVGVEENVQPPASLTLPDAQLPQYRSPEPVDAVLEVGATRAATYGLTVGTNVILE